MKKTRHWNARAVVADDGDGNERGGECCGHDAARAGRRIHQS